MTASKSPLPILEELGARGLTQDVMAPDELGRLLAQEQVSFYVGYDPTGTSLHAGSLVPITVMARLQKAGHKPYVLIGGATGMIGDPSGKSQERQQLSADVLETNIAGIRAQLSRFLDFESGPNAAVMVNNHDWFGGIGYLEFLRDVGKHVTVNYMMAKESVRARLEDRDQGISYTEFSYMLLQAYDFVVLARDHGIKLQVGGSDQWGNITAGVELYRKLQGGVLYGFTAPLLMGQQGEKMGKTAAGTKLWLDPDRTSPYAFYQHWLNVDDADVERMLKIFSWRSLDEIGELARQHTAAPQKRIGQRALAEDLTTFVHGEAATRGAIAASQVMFGGALDDVRDVDLEPLLADVPHSTLARADLEQGVELLELLATTKLAQSKGAARRLVKGGGVYVNNQRVDDAQRVLEVGDLGTESMLILRAGKKSYHIVRVG
jgi:tyrosyl-tRNA synthetase